MALENPIPLTFSALMNKISVQSDIKSAKKDPALATESIKKSLDQILINNSGDNKAKASVEIQPRRGVTAEDLRSKIQEIKSKKPGHENRCFEKKKPKIK